MTTGGRKSTAMQLPEGVIRFDPQASEDGAPGSLRRAVVVVDGADVCELTVTAGAYSQDGFGPGSWSLSFLADSADPLSRTLKVTR